MMNPYPVSRMAHTLTILARMAAVAMPVIAALIWFFWDDLAPLAGTGLDVTALDTPGRLLGFLLSLVGALIQSYGLLGLAKTFQEGARGDALSQTAVAGFRRFAWTVLLLVPVRALTYTLTVLLVTMRDAIPGNQLAIKVGTPELSGLFMGLILVFLAHVFAEGHAAQEENKAFL